LLIKGGLKFQGEFIERKRPIIPLLDSLKQLGGRYEFKDEIFHIYRENSECNSKIIIPGDITSQFITALLFLCPILQCDRRKSIKIQSSTPLVSYPYIKISLDVITKFQINILEKYQKDKVAEYLIPLGQVFKEQEFLIPGDFSSTSFIIAATILSPFNSKVKILNLDVSNPQGDKEFIEIIKKMGAKIEINSEDNSLLVYGNIQKNPLKGINIDCKSIPDLFPILSIIGMFAKGKTILYNAMTLRNKESDRIAVMSRELRKMDVKVIEKKDSLTIFPIKKKPLIKGMNHENDHRVAMALIVASLFGQVPTLIEDVEIIKDSYPRFIDDLINLGVKISRIKN
jgi:3-phosphoshikimate 1-carboxyvinyltransferase